MLCDSIQANKAAINLLFGSRQYYLKMDVGGWVEVKRSRFFEKNTKEKDIHTASQLPNMFS